MRPTRPKKTPQGHPKKLEPLKSLSRGKAPSRPSLDEWKRAKNLSESWRPGHSMNQVSQVSPDFAYGTSTSARVPKTYFYTCGLLASNYTRLSSPRGPYFVQLSAALHVIVDPRKFPVVCNDFV